MSSFIAYTDKVLQLMEMLHNGKDDTDEADLLREDLVNSECLLTEKEKQLVENLAGDLYMVYNESMYFKVPENEKQEQLNNLKVALEENNWVGVLNILRGSLGIPEYLIASYRGKAWTQLGNNDIALKFYQCAKRLNPEFNKE